MDNSIKIIFLNAVDTNDPNVMVVATSRNASDPDKDKLVAWKILVTQTSFLSNTPKRLMFTRVEDVITSGPYPAEPGSYWKITQENMKGAPTLKKGMSLVV